MTFSTDDEFYCEEEEISLTQDNIDLAVATSDIITDGELQWSVYLASLALSGFTAWLEDRDDELKIDTTLCPLFSGTSIIGAATRLKIGKWTVCVIPMGGYDGDYVTVPLSVLKNPEETAQYYVFVEVNEEQSEAMLYGFLRSDKLETFYNANPLNEYQDGTCELPTSWLNLEFDELLSYLRIFNADAVPLPNLV
jgi:Protein of unknown function (DUF1822)